MKETEPIAIEGGECDRRRVRIVTRIYSSRVRELVYGIVVQDTITHQLIARLAYRPGQLKMRSEQTWFTPDATPPDLPPGEGIWEVEYSNKAEAVKDARQAAKDCHLPFSPTEDILDYCDALQGPEQPCLLCSKPTGRGWVRKVCTACEEEHALAVAARAEQQRYRVIEAQVLHIKPRGGDSYARETLLRHLLYLAGTRADKLDTYHAQAEALYEKTPYNSYGEWWYVFLLKPEQATMLRAVLDLINAWGKGMYQNGYWDGSSLVARLSKGEVHPNDFADIRKKEAGR